MKLYFKMTIPFSVMGFVFITIGLVADDERQIQFGFVWLTIALIVLIVK